MALTPAIEGIIGPNNGHRINAYRHAYKFKNIPANLQAKFRANPDTEIYPVRMPYLGVDFIPENLLSSRSDIQKVPVGIILAQTLKLLEQVKHIKDRGYIHGDIRETNVMIRPDTGVMTLIDFDFLQPAGDFLTNYPFGFYCHPPETLNFFQTINYGKSALIASNITEYTKQVLNQFRVVLPLLDYPTTQSTLAAYLLRLQRENTRPVLREELTQEDLLRTFDSYGMAWTLLPVYAQIYPNSVLRETDLDEPYKVLFRTSLASRAPSGTNLDAAITAILGMTSRVLVPLSEMEFSKRLGIDEAVSRATAIVEAYEAAIASAPGTAIVGGGGATRRSARRKTRKRRL